MFMFTLYLNKNHLFFDAFAPGNTIKFCLTTSK